MREKKNISEGEKISKSPHPELSESVKMLGAQIKKRSCHLK